ncbi:MAG: hypothetical protein QM328_12180 [Acidobacteriota bacterium]|nr:hypothetical protein [Acidobacteriota bacterium]
MHRYAPWLPALAILLTTGAVAHTPDQPLGDPVVRVTFDTDGSSTHPLAGAWAQSEGLVTAPVHLGAEGAPQGERYGRLAARSEGASSAHYVIETVMRPGVFLQASALVRAPARPDGVTTQLAFVVCDAARPGAAVAEITRDIPAGEEWHKIEVTLDPIRLAGPGYYLSSVEFRADGLQAGQAVAMDLDDLLFTGDVDVYFERYLPRLAEEGAAALRASLVEVNESLEALPAAIDAPADAPPAVADALMAAAEWYAESHSRIDDWMASLLGQTVPPTAVVRGNVLDTRLMRSILEQAEAAGNLEPRGPYAIWRLDDTPERYPLPWDVAVMGQLVDRVALRATPGEPLHLALAIRSQVAAAGLMVRPGPLRGESGAAVPATAWDAKHLLWWWQAPRGATNGELVATPELLAHNPSLVTPRTDAADNRLDGPIPADAVTLVPVNAEAGEVRTFVLSLSVPRDLPPGAMSGEILIRSAAGEARLPYTLEILPFTVVDSDPKLLVELRSRLGPDDPGSLATLSERRMREVLADIQALGGPCSVTVDAPVPEDTDDLSELRAALALRMDAGMIHGPLLLHGTEPWLLNIAGHAYSAAGFAQHNEAFLARMRQVAELGKELGVEGLTVCGMPSAGVPLAHHQNVAAKACRGIGMPTYIEAQPGISHSTGHMAYVSLCRDDHTDSQAAKRMGFELWYRPEHTGIEEPARLRQEASFGLARRGYTGLILPYWQPCGDPLDDLDGVAKDRMTAYPSQDGLLRTVSWLGLREAVTDRQYLRAAEDLLERALGAAGVGGFGARPEVPEIEALRAAWFAALDTADPSVAREELRTAMAGVARWLQDQP